MWVIGNGIDWCLVFEGNSSSILIRYELVRQENEKRLVYSSKNDPLTNIANRKALYENMQHEVLRAERYHTNFGVIIIDIDFFKNINDTHGHIVGDHVLQSMVKSISKNIRNIDTLGRLGGEEFLIILPESKHSEVCDVAEKVRKYFDDNTIQLENNLEIKVTISAGVASYQKQDDITSLLARADSLLYKAKKEGRNRVRADIIEL